MNTKRRMIPGRVIGLFPLVSPVVPIHARPASSALNEQVAAEFPDFVARARSVWKHGWTGASSADLLDLTRGDR